MLGNHKLMFALMVLVCGAMVWSTHNGPLTIWQIVGAVIGVPSLAAWFLSRLQLGDSFSVSAQARELVTTGIYSKIRNPIYVFGFLFIASLIIYMQQFRWLLALPVLVGLQIWRVRKEEAVLEAKFGEEYRNYKARTWF